MCIRDRPNGEEKQSCGLLDGEGKLFDMACSEKICFNCHFTRASHYKLRGLCEDSDLDDKFTMDYADFEGRYSFKVGGTPLL